MLQFLRVLRFLLLAFQTTQEQDVVKVNIAKAATAGTYLSVFYFCTGRCRHNSESVVHENAYLSDFHHCFSLPSNASGGSNHTRLEAKLIGTNIVVGRQCVSCDSVCKSSGQSCVGNKLMGLNQCDVIKSSVGSLWTFDHAWTIQESSFMLSIPIAEIHELQRACLASIGSDQPAEVVDDAPGHLNPGSCLFTRTRSILNTETSKQISLV